MISISGPTLIRPHQIRLSELFTVVRILASRGFTVKSEGNGIDTIIAREDWSVREADLVFDLFNDPANRRKLLSYILSHGSVTEDSPLAQIIETSNFNPTRAAFSSTFEWYVGELMVRKFGAFSSSYGVSIADVFRNSDDENCGDYDVLSVLGTMDVLYFECKSGAFKGKHIERMIERARSLHVMASVMFIDTLNETSLRDKVSETTYPGLPRSPPLQKISIKGAEGSEIYQWHESFFVAGSPVANIEKKMRTILRLVEWKKAELSREISPGDENYGGAGYSMTTLWKPD